MASSWTRIPEGTYGLLARRVTANGVDEDDLDEDRTAWEIAAVEETE